MTLQQNQKVASGNRCLEQVGFFRLEFRRTFWCAEKLLFLNNLHYI
jgi:hypothetical protein